MRLISVTLLFSLLLFLTGCSTVTLYPIAKSDIQAMSKGVAYAPEKDGWFISDLYLQRVVEARVTKK